MTATTSNRRSLFIASCASLLVTSLSFGIRAGILNDLGVEFELNGSELSRIAATAFWGFPVSMIIGGALVDKVGMKNLMRLAYIGHFAGILLTIFAGGFWSLWISTLFIGLANGMVEAVCNPLVASIYPEEKTTKLNQFHLWFPGGIVIGSLVAFSFGKLGLSWQVMMAVMLLPTIWYALQMERMEFPVTERVANQVSDSDMYKALLNPLYIIITIAMLGTATSELFINQYVDVLLKSVSDNAILILLITSGVMTFGRGIAAPVVERFSTTGMLLFSAVFTTIGLYMMGTMDGSMLFVSAFVFGIGVTYFWPTMIGFVATYLPSTGAVGMAVIGAAGMFAVSIYMQFMGGFYDELMVGLSEVEAGRKVIMTTLYIPVALIAIFAGIHLHIRRKHS
jgi:fucose permease